MERGGSELVGKDEFENLAQPMSPHVLHTMYHPNGREDVVLPRCIVPVRAVPLRSVIRIKEVGPSHY